MTAFCGLFGGGGLLLLSLFVAMVCLWLAIAGVLLLLILINKDTYFGCVYVCVKENTVHESLSDVYGP